MLARFEVQRHAAIFGAAALALVIARVVAAAGDGPGLGPVFGLATLITWSLVVGYVVHELFVYYVLGRQLLLHISSVSRPQIVRLKSLVLVGYLVIFGVLTVVLTLGYYSTPEGRGLSTAEALTWVGGRAVSLAAFVAVVVLAVAIAKATRQKLTAVMAVVLTLALAVFGGAGLVWALGQGPNAEFFLGVSDSYAHLPGYALVLPVDEFGPGAVVGRLFWTGVAFNLTAGVLATLLASWLLRTQRANFFRI